MKAEYDLSKMKSRRNPYASKLKKSVTMRLSEDVVQYFKSMAGRVLRSHHKLALTHNFLIRKRIPFYVLNLRSI